MKSLPRPLRSFLPALPRRLRTWPERAADTAWPQQDFAPHQPDLDDTLAEAPPRLLTDVPAEQWDRVLGVNLKGVFLCCKAVVPAMSARGRGRIINISSVAGRRMTFFGSVDYTVSKYGVEGLTQHLAWELADRRITVNSICPGGVLTPLMEENITPEYREMTTRRLVPLGRMCTMEEIGEAASFLASDRAQMITGQSLAVDGGVLTGFGEDLRPVIRKRMAQKGGAHG